MRYRLKSDHSVEVLEVKKHRQFVVVVRDEAGAQSSSITWDLFHRTFEPIPDSAEPLLVEDELEFVECDSCWKKSGMPILCSSCIANRHAVYRAAEDLRRLRKEAVEREKENQWNHDHRKEAEREVTTLTRQVQLLTQQRDEAREALDQSQSRFMHGVPPDKPRTRKFKVRLPFPCCDPVVQVVDAEEVLEP